jgi:3-methyladenine DNA glycosylase AlkC
VAELLKHFFDAPVVRRIAAMIGGVHKTFPTSGFVADATRGLDQLELLPRAWHIAHALHRHLPADYEVAAAILKSSLGPRRAVTQGDGMSSFLYMPHVCFVAEYGVGHWATSLDLQYELTKRFTAEFSIRVFLERYPKQTLARLRDWTNDPDVHVRRLVSEGTRPRLPWAPRLRAFQQNPRPVLELLELLKDDPELYVRRSVANNLNDIGKDHPELLFETCKRWLVDASEERSKLVKHALRSAVKRAEPGALRVLGYGRGPAARVDGVKLTPRRVAIGGTVDLTFKLVSTARRKQSLLVDYRVHFVKADGTTKPKVFKLKILALEAGESAGMKAKISLRQMTTRKHYPGKHNVDIVVNGVVLPAGSFIIVD